MVAPTYTSGGEASSRTRAATRHDPLGRRTRYPGAFTDLYFAPKFFESRPLYEALGVGVARRLIVGLVLPAIALLQGASGWTAVVLWIVLILNVYPWLLQRYTRLRIQHLLAARGERL